MATIFARFRPLQAAMRHYDPLCWDEKESRIFAGLKCILC